MIVNLHPKVKWAAIGGALVTALSGALEAGDVTAPQWLTGLVTALVALAAGYLAPAVAGQDDTVDEGPES